MTKKRVTSEVGKALYDILSKEQHHQEVGETINELAPGYIEHLKSCIEDNEGKLESPFYVIVISKKEQYALNVVRHWFIARQTCPSSHYLMEQFPNFFHEVFVYNSLTGDCRLKWCLPAKWVHKEILNHPDSYDKQLVEFVWAHYGNELLGVDERHDAQSA